MSGLSFPSSSRELLRRLADEGVQLYLKEGRLHYSARRGAATPEVLRVLAARRAELEELLRLAAPAHHGVAERPPMTASGATDGELSYAQERLWFEEQVAPGSPRYNVPVVVRIAGPLDVAALAWSLTEVSRRHAALRTTFRRGADGRPRQVVGPVEPVALERTEAPAEAPADWVAAWVAADARVGFDIERGPLWRGRIAQVGPGVWVVQLTLHHLVTDAWSMGVLLRDVTALYEARVHGRAAGLAPLRGQYLDYAQWQRQWLRGAVLDEAVGYWRQQLAGLDDRLRLPPDAAGGAAAGALLPFTWAAGVSEAIRRLGRERGATLFMLLVAGLAVVLGRRLGARDVAVGADVANRTIAEVEELIGFFVNLVVLRVDLRGAPTFAEVVERVRATVLGANAHQDVPFDRVVDELQPPRVAGRTPLFQVLLVMQHAPLPALQLDGLALTPVPADTGTAKFELALFIRDTPGGIQGTWNYRTDLFRPETVQAVTRQLEQVLVAAAADPTIAIETLSLADAPGQVPVTSPRPLSASTRRPMSFTEETTAS